MIFLPHEKVAPLTSRLQVRAFDHTHHKFLRWERLASAMRFGAPKKFKYWVAPVDPPQLGRILQRVKSRLHAFRASSIHPELE